jgi:hypothetical protein
MNVHSAPIVAYRWITFLLAIGYVAYQLGTGDWSNPGGPLRFLTIWALFLSAHAAWRMLSISLLRSEGRHEVAAMTAAVFNIMVVYLYWKLFLTDPALVRNGPAVWHQEYYLHAVGPALQVIDALFIGRVFRRIWRGAVSLMLLVPIYVIWAELFVQRFNDTPTGSVTSGLPYPFLNSLDWPARAEFYLLYGVVALAILTALSGVGWVVARATVPASTARQ